MANETEEGGGTLSGRIKGMLGLTIDKQGTSSGGRTDVSPHVSSISTRQEGLPHPAPIKVGARSPVDREELVGTPSDIGVFMGHGFSGKLTFKRLFQDPRSYRSPKANDHPASSLPKPSTPSKGT